MGLLVGNKLTFDRALGQARIVAWSGAKDGEPYRDDQIAMGSGLMAGLVNAEVYAVRKGVIPGVTLPNGETGFVSDVGYAQGFIDEKTPEDIAVTYLATQQAFRRAFDNGRAAGAAAGGIPVASGASGLVGIAPVVLIVVGVVALSAYIAHRYFESEETKTQILIDGDRLKKAALTDKVIQLGLSGQKVDPAAWKILQDLANAEHGAGSKIPWTEVFIGGGLLLGAGLVIKNRRAIGRMLGVR